MFEIEFYMSGGDIGRAQLPYIPRIGEELFLSLDKGRIARFQVMNVMYACEVKRKLDGLIDRDAHGVVKLIHDAIEIRLEEITTDDPDFKYKQ